MCGSDAGSGAIYIMKATHERGTVAVMMKTRALGMNGEGKDKT